MSATLGQLRSSSAGGVEAACAPGDGGCDLATSDYRTLDSKFDEILNIDSTPIVNDNVGEEIIKFVLDNASTNEENRVVSKEVDLTS